LQQAEVLSKATGGKAWLEVDEVRRYLNLPPMRGSGDLV
jgi:hypothetical protein